MKTEDRTYEFGVHVPPRLKVEIASIVEQVGSAWIEGKTDVSVANHVSRVIGMHIPACVIASLRLEEGGVVPEYEEYREMYRDTKMKWTKMVKIINGYILTMEDFRDSVRHRRCDGDIGMAFNIIERGYIILDRMHDWRNFIVETITPLEEKLEKLVKLQAERLRAGDFRGYSTDIYEKYYGPERESLEEDHEEIVRVSNAIGNMAAARRFGIQLKEVKRVKRIAKREKERAQGRALAQNSGLGEVPERKTAIDALLSYGVGSNEEDGVS